jgi:acetate kinase
MKILVLNSGSSSQKSALLEIGVTPSGDAPAPSWEAKIEWDGGSAEVHVRNAQGAVFESHTKVDSRSHAIAQMLDTLWSGETRVISSASEIGIVGHRVVQGGQKFEEPTIITPEVKAAIGKLSAYAPLHNPAALEGIEIIEEQLGPVPQVAVFDTGFHRRMPDSAAVYPGPYEWLEQGIRRYGFHGINHQYCAGRTAQMLGRELKSLKIVSCHLGNGCSLAAIRNGRSVDTTMGFTPLEGLMMGTRSGSVDPGILTYLMRQNHSGAEQIDELLNTKSGLLGVSGISGDMRQIVSAMKDGHARAKLAFDIFVHRLQSGIGSMVAALGGVDVLIFTAGIGENSPEVRAAACENFRYMGLKIDRGKNTRPDLDQDIAQSDSTVRILVIRAQEDWAIARECWRLASAKIPMQPTTIP